VAPRYDFAIFGASPLAALLCGLLAHRHDKLVLRVADPAPRQRLPRSIDIALPLATRPAGWHLLRAAVTETATLLATIGGQDRFDRTDVRLVADLPETTDALAHLTHIAAAYGLPGQGGLFRGVPRLSGEIDLASSAVQTVEAGRVMLTPGRDGTGLALDGDNLPVAQIVLADDASILDLLPPDERPQPLLVQPAMATLTAPARRLPTPVMRYLDRGVTLVQNKDRSVLALVEGQADADARLASCLAGPFPLQRRATTHYHRLATIDGAPLIGRLARSGLLVIAGIGSSASFLAPPLARLLAGVATDEEQAWFAAHDPSGPSRAPVADIAWIQA
jgi:hypothetical protein